MDELKIEDADGDSDSDNEFEMVNYVDAAGFDKENPEFERLQSARREQQIRRRASMEKYVDDCFSLAEDTMDAGEGSAIDDVDVFQM